jgi:hypothetical protein
LHLTSAPKHGATPLLLTCAAPWPSLQVRYSASLPALPLGLSGEHFVAVAGAQASSLESLLVKRGLRGPGWTTLSAPTRRKGSGMVRGWVADRWGAGWQCCSTAELVLHVLRSVQQHASGYCSCEVKIERET